MKSALELKNEYEKALQQEETQNKLRIKREELLIDAKGFREMAREETKLGNVEKAKHYQNFADDTEKQAHEILLDGESPKANEEKFTPSEHFGKGADAKKTIVWRFIFTIALVIGLFFLSELIQSLGDQISISVGSELIHFFITVIEWWTMWFVVDSFLLLNYRAIYDFLNTHKYPQFDFVSRCLDGHSPEAFALFMLFLKAFTFVLMFLHSPVTNAG